MARLSLQRPVASAEGARWYLCVLCSPALWSLCLEEPRLLQVVKATVQPGLGWVLCQLMLTVLFACFVPDIWPTLLLLSFLVFFICTK